MKPLRFLPKDFLIKKSDLKSYDKPERYLARKIQKMHDQWLSAHPVIMGNKYRDSPNAIGGWHSGRCIDTDTHTGRLVSVEAIIDEDGVRHPERAVAWREK